MAAFLMIESIRNKKASEFSEAFFNDYNN